MFSQKKTTFDDNMMNFHRHLYTFSQDNTDSRGVSNCNQIKISIFNIFIYREFLRTQVEIFLVPWKNDKIMCY